MLEIPPSVAEEIREHAKSAHPQECGGILLGTLQDGIRQAVRLGHPEGFGKYGICSELIREAVAGAKERGLELLGFYHSHPEGSAEPSNYDLSYAIVGFSYLIVAGDELRSWVLNDSGSCFKEEAVISVGGERGDSKRLSETVG